MTFNTDKFDDLIEKFNYQDIAESANQIIICPYANVSPHLFSLEELERFKTECGAIYNGTYKEEIIFIKE